jgi:DNA-binding NarL/FixJ family response regulator
MTRVYLADAIVIERNALRILLLDMNMEIAGEAGDWATALANIPICNPDMLVVDWELLPRDAHAGLNELRVTCPNMLAIILISHLEARQQAARTVGADMFISKSELPERVAEYLRIAAGAGNGKARHRVYGQGD